MSKIKLSLLHLYPDRMNIYGDFGNIVALNYHLTRNKIDFEYVTHEVNDKLTKSCDIVFMGGGQDMGQLMVAKDLQKQKQYLKDHYFRNKPILTICGGYQLFGHAFNTSESIQIKGIGLFDAITSATSTRMIGNIVVDSSRFGKLVGFENHSGATELLNDSKPLGRVISGFGNNTEKRFEGILSRNAIGTYMHGSFLPKNPKIVKFIIEEALKIKSIEKRLDFSDCELESKARDYILQKVK